MQSTYQWEKGPRQSTMLLYGAAPTRGAEVLCRKDPPETRPLNSISETDWKEPQHRLGSQEGTPLTEDQAPTLFQTPKQPLIFEPTQLKSWNLANLSKSGILVLLASC